MRLIIALMLVSCGQVEPTKPSVKAPELLAEIERVEPLLSWTCDGLIPSRAYDFPCVKEGDGVSMLGRWIADTGDTSRLDGIRNSIGPDGRLWRNPERVGNDDANSASRDQFLGVIESGDKQSIKAVLSYVKEHGNLCPGDDRCKMTPSVRMLAEEALGVSHTQAEIGFDIETIHLEAETAPSNYRAYLVARKLFLKAKMGNLNQGYAKVAERLADRYPKSLFIQTVDKMANGGSFKPIVNEMTACLKRWKQPGNAWHGEAINGCTDNQQGHDLVGLAKFLIH